MPVFFDLAAAPMLVPLLLQVAPAAGNGTAAINAAGALNFFTALLALAQTVGVPAFGVSAAWNGYQLMFSTSPRNQDGAKEHLKWSVIGLVLILAANQVADIIKQAAGATGTGGG
jgi:4-amino-4-deoxy-L-arabinose transferase-like glycosyltransferase